MKAVVFLVVFVCAVAIAPTSQPYPAMQRKIAELTARLEQVSKENARLAIDLDLEKQKSATLQKQLSLAEAELADRPKGGAIEKKRIAATKLPLGTASTQITATLGEPYRIENQGKEETWVYQFAELVGRPGDFRIARLDIRISLASGHLREVVAEIEK